MGFFNGAYEAYVNGNINNEYQAKALRFINKEQSKTRCTCGKCDISFASISDYQKHICGMENKMTREEAAKKACVGEYGNTIVTALHNLGLLKFDEPKEVVRLCSKNQKYRCGNLRCGILLNWSKVSKIPVDHCHKTGKVRALLCIGCNTTLGHLEIEDERLKGLHEYIERHK